MKKNDAFIALIALLLTGSTALAQAPADSSVQPAAENPGNAATAVETKPASGSIFRDNGKDAVHVVGWFPGTRLYPTMMADPRKTVFSATLRIDDDAFDKYGKTPTGEDTSILGDNNLFSSISAGGRIPFYRWKLPAGFFQFGMDGSVRALFSMESLDPTAKDMSTLLNADYLVALTSEYAWNDLAVQFRFYHVSTHVGDELIELYTGFERVNVSFEAIELYVSYFIVPQVRIYFGIGCVIQYVEPDDFDPVMFDYGVEFRPFAPMKAGGLLWQPYFAMHFRNYQYNDWSFDGRYSIGVEFIPDRRFMNTRFQIALDFYSGRSCDGQFYTENTSFVEIGFSFEL